MICETATAVAFYDGYPVSKGHTLIIPKRHTASYFDLTTHEQRALWLMVNHCKKILEDRFHPNGFNVGINVNEAAGQIRIQNLMSQRD
ncbi:MAG: HIT family protein [Bacteroidales bacterium]|nr:HIT family protein [Bacteroidales bacterium]